MRAARLLLLLLACAASAACPPAGASLPRQRSAWPVLGAAQPRPPACVGAGADRNCSKPWETRTTEAQPAHERLFSSALTRAAVATSWPDALRPLLARLRSGEPLRMLSMGSSIVETGSGCFASRAALHAAGVAVVPPVENRTLPDAPDATCSVAGFAADFMAAVNATWPHPQHVYINAGQGGAGLDAFADYACTDTFLPSTVPVDVLLLEAHTTDVMSRDAELVRQIETIVHNVRLKTPPHADGSSPAVIVFNAFPLGDTEESVKSASSCIGDFGARCAACGSENQSVLQGRLLRAFANTASSADAVAAAARRYGWASLSLRDAMLAGLRDGAHTALGWSACEWLNVFYRDRIHPSQQASRMIGDAMLQLLLQAQDAEEAACGDADDAFVQGAAALPPLQQSRFVPIAKGAFAAPLKLCNAGQNLDVRSADGFAYASSEIVKNRTVWKPGWIARTPGATLDFAVAASFQGAPAGANATLKAVFLRSYEHMGIAQLTCLSGCACDGVELQGHGTEHVSVEDSASMNVTQAHECVLRLAVQPETRSGEHKVKLISLTAYAPTDPEPQSTAPPEY